VAQQPIDWQFVDVSVERALTLERQADVHDDRTIRVGDPLERDPAARSVEPSTSLHSSPPTTRSR